MDEATIARRCGVDTAMRLVAMRRPQATGVLRHRAGARVPRMYEGRENGLSDVQAEAILNMRLRSLRRLEEEALVRERDALMEERAGLEDLLARMTACNGAPSPISCAR